MWTRMNCPFCYKAMGYFEERKIPYEKEEIDFVKNQEEVFQALMNETKQRTFPNIFIGETHVGGQSDLQRLVDENKIDDLLKKEGVL